MQDIEKVPFKVLFLYTLLAIGDYNPIISGLIAFKNCTINCAINDNVSCAWID